MKERLGWEPMHVLHHKNDIVQECGVQVWHHSGQFSSGSLEIEAHCPMVEYYACGLTGWCLPQVVQVAMYLNVLLRIIAGAFKVRGPWRHYRSGWAAACLAAHVTS